MAGEQTGNGAGAGDAMTAGPDVLMTPVEVTALLRLAPRTLEKWRATGKGPRFVRFSHAVIRYWRSDVLRFAGARETPETAAAPAELPQPATPAQGPVVHPAHSGGGLSPATSGQGAAGLRLMPPVLPPGYLRHCAGS